MITLTCQYNVQVQHDLEAIEAKVTIAIYEFINGFICCNMKYEDCIVIMKTRAGAGVIDENHHRLLLESYHQILAYV